MEITMETINEILSKLDTADNTNKNELENKLVSIGNEAVPVLVEELQSIRGLKRGIIAMTLIRLGQQSVKYLEDAARKNKDFEWIAQYLIREINGCQVAA